MSITLRSRALGGALAATLAVGLLGLTSPAHGRTEESVPKTASKLAGSPAAAAGAPALVVSEINGDNNGVDYYEYFEVHNPTDVAVDLDALGIEFRYSSSDADGQTGGTLLTRGGEGHALPLPAVSAVIPAHGTTLFWFQNSGDAYLAKTDADFRGNYGLDASVPLVHVTGQNGFSNGGGRSIRIVAQDGTEISRSWVPARTSIANGSVHYRVPATTGTSAPIWHDGSVETTYLLSPGVIDPEQLAAGSGPTEPTEPPAGPNVPTQGPPPATDPDLDAPVLQVTEVAPDTANVGGSDAYEFIEVYNASDAPVRFSDFTINYLYIDASELVTNSVLWPAVPADPVIAPGRALVLWVKNARNGAFTAADFNAHFGAHLTAGTDLVEIQAGGMANGGLRGLQVMTNTGHDISRAFYHNDADTVADQPLQYRWDTGTLQTKLGPDTATPGYVAPAQVPTGLVATPAETAAPVIEDLTGGTETPDTEDLTLEFQVTDDRQVRTVALTLDTDVDEPNTRSLRFGAPDRYTYTIPSVDLFGKRWIEYTVTTSDGTHTRTLGPVRIDLADGPEAPVRLNVTDDQYVGGQTRLAATTANDPADLSITVDDAPVADPVPALESAPIFAFEATSTDAFFRNGVRIGEQVLTVFDEGFYDRIETVTATVPVGQVVKGERLTVGIYAGTKAWPQPDLNENNDDFSALNLRLALPDGRVLRPVSCAGAGEGQEETVRACPDPATRIGFSDANQVYFTATFAIPDDAFDSLAHVWDTTQVEDGPHQVAASAGADQVTRTVRVDNTAPSVDSALDDRLYRGAFTIDAVATDAGAGLVPGGLTAELDDTPVDLPHQTSSLELEPGEHEVVFTARDKVGNETTRTITFTTADEQPASTLVSPADGTTVTTGDVPLTATVGSPADDELTVRFREGHTFLPTDGEVRAYDGTTGTALGADRGGKVELTAEQLAAVAGTDGVAHQVSSGTALPYQLFTVAVPADAGDGARARLSWTGSANANAKVLLYVRDAGSGTWQEVARHVTDSADTFELEALVPTAGHVRDGQITVLVQHSEGFAGQVQSTRADTPEAYHPGATPRSDYDFTIGWESDTQYYNETQDWYPHQLAINRFLIEQREELNLQYVIHTGDIVNVASEQRQWENADPAYRLFDEAWLPYGVLAGNHDVGGHDNDYTAYSRWFGEDRFRDNPWYGGSHQDNRGHYDLVSANGIDFLMLYMGWGPGDEQIAWMNEVIAKYPERKVWVNLHEFMLTTGGLGPIPQRIMDEVVATNPNVFAVSSGHYHDAYTRTDEFDDDGDGTADRTVYSMLFDYQGLPEGGLGYLRLMHFDNTGQRIMVRTYSPSLDDFDSDDASLNTPPGQQEFEIPYAAVDINPVTKTLATDSFQADILTTRDIGVRTDVPTGSTETVTWSGLGAGEHGWFVETTGPHGGHDISEVRTFTAVAPAGSQDFTAAPTPTVTGEARVGSALTAVPGTWAPADPAITFTYQWAADGTPVADAFGPTLSVGADLVGKTITVTVTGNQAGYTQTARTSQPTAGVVEGELAAPDPVVSGEARVGSTLSASAGSWTPGAELTYQWTADGTPLAGSTGLTLTLGADHVGRRIAVSVTGSLDGYADATRTSVPTDPVAGAEVVAGTPTVRGPARVGEQVRVDPGTWTEGTTLSYQWLIDGRPFAGATATTYVLRPGQVGRRVSVEVTGSLSGYDDTARRSAARRVTAGRIDGTRPTISGVLRVGRTLTVRPGRWAPGSVDLRYRWLAGGKLIRGEFDETLDLRRALAGKRIRVRVIGSARGYTTLVKTSRPTARVRR